jgi:tetrahydromethanopterin S-methyltransferase subunit C
MIDLSLAGLTGAILGTIVAAIVYGAVAGFLERRYLALRVPADQDRETLVQEMALLRRGVLTFDLLLFCVLGYWLGERVAG